MTVASAIILTTDATLSAISIGLPGQSVAFGRRAPPTTAHGRVVAAVIH